MMGLELLEKYSKVLISALLRKVYPAIKVRPLAAPRERIFALRKLLIGVNYCTCSALVL